MALSFPKFNLWWLAWVALVPFFIALNRAENWKGSAANGFVFGIVFFGVNLFWLTSLYRFVGGWIILGWVALVVFQTLFIVLFALGKRGCLCGAKAIMIPAMWVVAEWLRSSGPFGVTAGDLGYSQSLFLPVIQIASLTTVYGVSYLIAFFNFTLAEWLEDRRHWLGLTAAIMLILVSLVYGYKELGVKKIYSSQLRLAIVQPSIDQMDKMDIKKVLQNYLIHEQLTRQAMAALPDLIIWPETALFTYLLHDPVLLPKVKQLAIDSRAWLVMGTPHYEGNKIYNSIISISPSGEVVSRYDKQRPVPFGEYLPFRPILFPLLGSVGYYDQAFDANPQSKNVMVGKYRLASAICFESTFPDFIGQRVKEGSDFILVVTNDSWFADSDAPYQHIEDGILRAVENRQYFVQAANTGISAVFDPYGREVARSRINQRMVLPAQITLP